MVITTAMTVLLLLGTTTYSNLSDLIGDVNRLVFGSSPIDFFASLFYAEYEPATRVLKYVNAGHNPPIVVRFQDSSCKVFQLNSKANPSESPPTRNFGRAPFSLKLATFWSPTPMESRKRRIGTASTGGNRGSRRCCVLAEEQRPSKSLNPFSTRSQVSRVASLNGTI